MHLEALELPVQEALQNLLLLKACLGAMRVRLELKYSDTQPRWPAGDPRGGQWMPEEGGEGALSRSNKAMLQRLKTVSARLQTERPSTGSAGYRRTS